MAGIAITRRAMSAAELRAAAGRTKDARLAEIAPTVAPGAHALIILDGAAWHGARNLVVPDNISRLPLPPYAPELNPVENVWVYLRANKFAISVFDTCDDIARACCNAWNFFANDPTVIASITSRAWAEVNR